MEYRRTSAITATTKTARITNSGMPKKLWLAGFVYPSGRSLRLISLPFATTKQRPRKMLIVPSVATIEGTLKMATMTPLHIPSARPIPMPQIHAS